MIPGMEPLHISEGDLAKDVRSILQRVETGAEVVSTLTFLTPASSSCWSRCRPRKPVPPVTSVQGSGFFASEAVLLGVLARGLEVLRTAALVVLVAI